MTKLMMAKFKVPVCPEYEPGKREVIKVSPYYKR